MNVDALTIGAICAELQATVLGGRVQHAHLPDEYGLALELYAVGGGPQGREGAQGARGSRWLYASAHPQRARLHLVSARPPRPADEVTPLLLLLRKYVDGGRLDAVSQPELERIARLEFSRRAPSGEVWQTTLVVEVLGRQSNLVLLDTDGTVHGRGAAGGAPAEPQPDGAAPAALHPPPLPDRLDPRWLEPAELAATAGDYAPRTRMRELLVSEVRACSPLLAREVVFRAHGDVDAPVSGAGWGAIAEAFHEIWGAAAEGRWAPTVAREGERLLAFAPYPLRSFPDVRPVASISRAVEEWFGQAYPARPTPWRRARPPCARPSTGPATAGGRSASRCTRAWWTSRR